MAQRTQTAKGSKPAKATKAATSATRRRPAYQHGVYPDARGRFGEFGGRFVPESLMAALDELEREYERARR